MRPPADCFARARLVERKLFRHMLTTLRSCVSFTRGACHGRHGAVDCVSLKISQNSSTNSLELVRQMTTYASMHVCGLPARVKRGERGSMSRQGTCARSATCRASRAVGSGASKTYLRRPTGQVILHTLAHVNVGHSQWCTGASHDQITTDKIQIGVILAQS